MHIQDFTDEQIANAVHDFQLQQYAFGPDPGRFWEGYRLIIVLMLAGF